jgi:2,4-dienoyl-CoA reductase-like NADH-dependent reductase (Old Yellow Enzyme family)
LSRNAFNSIFSEAKIGNVTLKNRLVMAPMVMWLKSIKNTLGSTLRFLDNRKQLVLTS